MLQPARRSVLADFAGPPPTTTPSPVAVSSFDVVKPSSLDVSPAGLTQPGHTSASTIVEAVPIDPQSITLNWTPAAPSSGYDIYSDMGRDYGLYVYKARVTEPTFEDTTLQPAVTYHYRIRSQTQRSGFLETTIFTPPDVEFRSSRATGRAATTLKVTPAPTALPPDAVILGLLSDNKFTDEFGLLTIVGEVRNDSNLTVGQSQIAITLYDRTGTIIDTAEGQPMLEVIPPGETSPFIIKLPRPAGLASYSLRAIARPVTPRLSPQLAVTELRRFEDTAGFFHIKGKIQNVGKITARRVKVAAIIYGRDERVINVSFTYITPPALAPGQEADYDILFTYYPRYATQAVLPFEE